MTPEYPNTHFVPTTSRFGDIPSGLVAVDQYRREQDLDEGIVEEELWGGASTTLGYDDDPIGMAETMQQYFGVDGELKAVIKLGEKAEYMIVKLPNASASSAPITAEEGDKYAILGPRAQVWLNLATENMASERTREAMLADICMLAAGESCQIGRGRYESSAGHTVLRSPTEDLSVSLKHVKLICQDDGDLKVIDTHSTNGVKVYKKHSEL